MKFLIAILLTFTLIGAKAQSKVYSISLTVVDEKGEILPGATVFLTNTKQAGSTDANGKITFNNLATGNYQLVAKMLGYAAFIKDITLEKNEVISARLQVDTKLLKEVIVKSNNPNRANYLKIFIENFIGNAVNASQCTILNPNALRFKYDKDLDLLEASTDTMLIIENRGLGYKLNYLLTDFRYDTKNREFSYVGRPFFQDIAGNAEQQAIWDNNRDIAYKGSMNHFFKSLFNHTAETDGFYVYVQQRHPTNKDKRIMVAIKSDSLTKAIDANFKMIRHEYTRITETDTATLYVAYRGERAPSEYTSSRFYMDPPVKLLSNRDELSQLKVASSSIFFNKNGERIPVASFITWGYWAWEKMSELLPAEYIPKTTTSFDSKLIMLESQ